MDLDPKLEELVDNFAAAIKAKLLNKQRSGFFGFNQPHMQGPIEQKLKKNVRSKDWVDVGALAAMRHEFNNSHKFQALKKKCDQKMDIEGNEECRNRRKIISGLGGCLCRKRNCFKMMVGDSEGE